MILKAVIIFQKATESSRILVGSLPNKRTFRDRENKIQNKF